ncbi:hypothetical protein [Spirillospora sp. CA-128828]|uniref:hypothetical protein n=1 Tax=Spirillospora sp. CA-128828 TaxID=3240033 RepID=UPI003D90652F
MRGAAVVAGATAVTPLLGEVATARTGRGAQLGPIPPDIRPGGAYDRYIAKLAAEDKFSGVVLLSHRGRTVLSRSYGCGSGFGRWRNGGGPGARAGPRRCGPGARTGGRGWTMRPSRGWRPS